VKGQLSPRIGLSQPITDRSIIYFSYGHFFQNPDYELFYSSTRNLDPANLVALDFGLVGNRNIEPQKTVAYEVGVKQEITADLGLNVTAFFKDIHDLVGTEEVRITTETGPFHYTYFSNIDYGNVKGFELTLDRRYRGHIGWDLNYTYSIARGSHSIPLEGFFNVLFEQQEENQDFFLDFDRRHVISADVTLEAAGWEGPEILGMRPLARTGLSAIIQYASGLPYTPSSGIPGLLLDKNSARLPWTGTVDLNLHRRFGTGALDHTLFVEITNLLDRRNVRYVDPVTGSLWYVPVNSAEAVDAAFDPNDVGEPRIVRLGVRTTF